MSFLDVIDITLCFGMGVCTDTAELIMALKAVLEPR